MAHSRGARALGTLEIRFPRGASEVLGRDLSEPLERGGERVCIGLVGSFSTAVGSVLTVAKLLPVPDSEYVVGREGTSWTSSFMASALSEAMRRGTGVLLIHSHGFSPQPTLSTTDERSFREILPRFRALLPDRPHGSIVIGRELSVGGKVVLPNGQAPLPRVVDRARWIDAPVRIVPKPRPDPPARRDVYDRQELVIGQYGQDLLNNAVLGIVGLGGGGSHVVQQAAYAGFGTLVLIDHDRVEPTNMSRLAGAVIADVGRCKTDVFSDLVHRIRQDLRVRTVTERFPSEAGLQELRNSDLVVSCLDSLAARVELQKFSWRYLIPLVDIGMGTRLKKEDGPARAESVAGHVHVYLPGGPCMWCTGLLTTDKLAAESGGKGPEYVEGAASPAQVVSINGVVASMAVTEAMQLVTGFIARDQSDFLRTYDAVKGDLYSLRPPFRGSCPHASAELGLGTPAGYSPSMVLTRKAH